MPVSYSYMGAPNACCAHLPTIADSSLLFPSYSLPTHTRAPSAAKETKSCAKFTHAEPVVVAARGRHAKRFEDLTEEVLHLIMALLEVNEAARLAVLHQLLRRTWASLPEKHVAVTMPVVGSCSRARSGLAVTAPEEGLTSAAALRLVAALGITHLTVNLRTVPVREPPGARTGPRLDWVPVGTLKKITLAVECIPAMVSPTLIFSASHLEQRNWQFA